MVRPVHVAVKGRARFKVAGLYRSALLKDRIELTLNSLDGIREASANTHTGNVLVYFNSHNTPESIASAIAAAVYDCKSQHCNNHSSENKEDADGIIPPRLKQAPGEQVRPVVTRRKLRKSIVKAEEQKPDPWHQMDAREVAGKFGTSRHFGLPNDTAKTNLKRYGPNVLPEAVPRSGLSIFLGQFNSLPVALLGAAAGISIATGGVADAIVIAGVVVINAVIGYTTETQAEKTIHALKSLVRPSATVKRDEQIIELGAEEVVPGDLLILRPGSYVPADARLLETYHMSVDESALTGESLPVMKTSLPCVVEEIPLADRVNMVYMGTLVTGGQGIAVVVATGRFTEIGKIQALVGEAESPDTPMERQLHKMGTQLVFISGAVCGLVFIVGLLRGYGFLEMLKSSISLAVAAVPEGLPTVATTTLALGIRDMRRHNVLIRHLSAVETLGAVQTICLDKTGTITMNRMSVVAVHTGMKRYEVSNGTITASRENVSPYAVDELLRLLHVSVLCSESEVEREKGTYAVSGSPTENALIYMALNAGINAVSLRERSPVMNITHRSESRNYMSTVHKSESGSAIIAVKGSPDEVLSICNWHMKGGKKLPLTEEDVLFIETENERMAGQALRVLGFAYSSKDDEVALSEDRSDLHEDLIWLGLVGMADPIRENVKELVHGFHEAGIDTVMITGDQSPTAYAIGKELNLSNNGHLEILDSTHLANVEPEVMKALCERVHVFARVSPAHKLQIVQALQSAGKVVAMTGDGINDGPALKAADIGIAMGHTGTDVAREVADVIIEDDNLETMLIAVSRGRTIYNNIRKSVHFLLSTNLSEIMVMFTAVSTGLGQPLNAMQLLWINLISDIAPGLALALELPEPDVLSRPPRDPHEPIVRNSDFKRIAFESAMLSAGSLGAYGYGTARYGIGPRAGSLAFLSLTAGQLLHALSCRSEQHSMFSAERLPRNKYLEVALGGSFALQILAVTVPGLRRLLGIGPISIIDGLVIGGSAAFPLLVNEATKSPLRLAR